MVKPSFDISIAEEEISQIGGIYRLYEVSDKYLTSVLYTHPETRILSLRHFQLDTSNEYTPSQEIRNIFKFEEQRFDIQPFTKVIFNFTESNLVPEDHIESSLQDSLMRLIYGDAEKGVILQEAIPDLELMHIYRIPAEMFSMIRQFYPESEHAHLYSKMIPLYRFDESGEESLIKLEFYTDRYIILIYNEKELKIVNTYFYQTPEDVVFYMLALCDELQIAPATINISVSGLIDEQSPLFAELNKYFARVNLDGIPEEIIDSGLSNEFPDHYFSNLMKLATCG